MDRSASALPRVIGKLWAMLEEGEHTPALTQAEHSTHASRSIAARSSGLPEVDSSCREMASIGQYGRQSPHPVQLVVSISMAAARDAGAGPFRNG